MMRLQKLFICVILCCWFGGSGSLWGQEGRDFWQQLRQDWEARRRWASVAEYRLEGERTVCAGSLGKQEPEEDVTHPLKIRWLLDFPQGRLRKEMDWTCPVEDASQKTKFLPAYKIMVYDGKDYAVVHPREKNHPERGPDIIYETGEKALTVWSCDYPIFYGHGYVPGAKQGPVPGRLIIPLPQREEWIVVGRRSWKEQECWILRTGSSASNYEYWINRQQQSAVVRCLSRVRGKLWSQLDIDYQQTRWGWLPITWVHVNFRDGIRVENITELRVAEFTLDPAVTSKDFQPPLEAGRTVLKPKVKGDARNYVAYSVGPGGELQPYQKSSRWSYSWVFLLAAILLGLGLMLWLWQRARRQV